MKKLDYLNTAHQIATYLSVVQNQDGSFPGKNYYGETFSILLWNFFEKEFEENKKKTLDFLLHQERKEEPLCPYHWEFNNYALLKYYGESNDSTVLPLLEPLQFSNIWTANWSLLRALCLLLRGGMKNNIRGYLEIARVLLYYQKKGFIFDQKGIEKGSKSFQYHVFSTALLGEIHFLTKRDYFKNIFLKGINYVMRFILPNGDALYIGRGQEQIFGYGSLLYALEYASSLTGIEEYRKKASMVFSFLSQFQREDGSFPLVLRKEETGFPGTIDLNDDRFLGWYRYNSCFDYLPFLGYFLIKAAHLSQKGPSMIQENRSEEPVKGSINYQNDEFLIHSTPLYTAVISRPWGRWANDMPFPYLFYKGENVTPCYGGEQLFHSLYSGEAIPLPFGTHQASPLHLRRRLFYSIRKIYYRLIGASHLLERLRVPDERIFLFRDFLRYRIKRNSLSGRSRLINHTRVFNFRDTRVEIRNEIEFRKDFSFETFYPTNFLFFEVESINPREYFLKYRGAKVKLTFSEPCYVEERPFYCARGKLTAIRESFSKPRFKRGDKIIRNLTLDLL